MNGKITNGTIVSRRWLLAGAVVSTAQAYVASAAESLVYKVTATGPGGTTIATSSAVTVAQVVTPPSAGGLKRLTLAEPKARGDLLAGLELTGRTPGSTLSLVTNGYEEGSSYAGLTINSVTGKLDGVADRPSALVRERTSEGSVRNSLLFFPKAGPRSMKNGMNLPGWNYYTPNRVFLDRMKFAGFARPPLTADNNLMPQSIDPQHGHVQYLTSVGLAGEPASNYHIVTDGDMDIGGFVKQGADYVKMMPAGFNIAIIQINAIRTAPTYFALVREDEVAAFKAGGQFQQGILGVLSGFAHIRTMNVHGGNFPDPFTTNPNSLAYADSAQCPVKVLADLAIAAGIGLWINVHHKTPISTFVSVYLPQLDRVIAAGHPVYVEHSNEIWNGVFPQNKYGNDTAIAMGWTGNTYTGSTWFHGKRTAELGIASRGRGYRVCGGVQSVLQNDLAPTFWAGFETIDGSTDDDLWGWYITNYASGSLTLGIADQPLGLIQDSWIENGDYDAIFDNILNNTMPIPGAESYASRAGMKHYAEALAVANAHDLKLIGYEGANFHMNRRFFARNDAYGHVFYSIPKQPLAYAAINQILEDSEESGWALGTAFDLDSGAPSDSPFGRFGLYGLPGFAALVDWNAKAVIGATLAPPPTLTSHRF